MNVKELEMPYSESFPERLRNYRLDNGFTQKHLATKWFVSSETISAWEKGRRKPSIKLVPKLASELEMDTEELIEYISEGGIKSKESVNQQKNNIKFGQIGLNFKMFQNQQMCELEIRKEAQRAKTIKVLTIRGDKYFVGTQSFFHQILDEETATIELLVLSPEAEHVTEELARRLQHKSAEEIREGMRHSLDYLMGFVRRHNNFSIKCYKEEPIFKLLIFDDVMFVSSYAREIPKNDTNAEMFMIREGNSLFEGFEKHFHELLKRSVFPGDVGMP